MKDLDFLSNSSIDLSTFLCINSSYTSYFCCLALLITGSKKKIDKMREQVTAINKYKKIYKSFCFVISLSFAMTAVDYSTANNKEFIQF